MRMVMTVLALSLAIGSSACKKKSKPDDNTGNTMGSNATGSNAMGQNATGQNATGSNAEGSNAMGSGATGSGGSMAGSDNAGMNSGTPAAGSGSAAAGDVEMSKKAGNCPSTVLGATTKAELKGKDVVLTITSDDKDAIAAIQKRTAELIKEKSDAAAGGAAHDQKGSHGGGMGICPVFFGEGGTAKSAKAPKGVTITITPKDKPDELKKTIDERIAKAIDWVKVNVKPGDAGNMGGVGGGKGGDGSTHKGTGDGKGKERKGGTGGGAGTGGGGSKGTGAGSGNK